MKKLLSLLLLVSITAFIACKGDMGDIGPAGQNGQDGINGQDGNANVKDYVATISPPDWVYHTSNLSYVDLQVPIITEQIAATGMVMVYWHYTPADVWFALPWSETSSQSYYFWFKPGLVRIHTQNDNAAPTKFSGDVRIIAVSSEGLVRNPDLDWTNYEDVKNRLQLPE